MITPNTVVRVGEVTASVSTFLRLGRLHIGEGGEYLTVGKNPHPPYVVPPSIPCISPQFAPNSFEDLQQRGFRVMRGKTREADRVEVGGGYFRISAAIANGLI